MEQLGPVPIHALVCGHEGPRLRKSALCVVQAGEAARLARGDRFWLECVASSARAFGMVVVRGLVLRVHLHITESFELAERGGQVLVVLQHGMIIDRRNSGDHGLLILGEF